MSRIQFIYNNKPLGECKLPNATTSSDRMHLAFYIFKIHKYNRFIITYVNNKFKIIKTDSNLNKKLLYECGELND